MKNLRPSTTLLAALLALPISDALAQQVGAPRPLPPFATSCTAGADGCRAARVRAFASAQAAAAHRTAVADPRHERLMNRYDMRWLRADIALERTSNEIGAGTHTLTRARNRSLVEPLDSVGFELNAGLVIDSVQIGGVRVAAARIQRQPSGDVVARPVQPVAAGATFDVEVWYHGTPLPNSGSFFGQGLTSEPMPPYGNRVTWTLSSPFAASDWYPAKQVLADKLDSVAINITTDTANKAGSNGLLRRTVALPGNKVRYEWASAYPISYYLASATVSDFQEYTTYAKPANRPSPADSVPVLTYFVNHPNALPDAQPWLDMTGEMIENFSDKFGLYPFWQEKYGHCMAPIGGGMEHQTMSTMGGFSFTLVAHELCHQWFGDYVTCRSYRDIWLNEGFATYGEYVTIEALAPAGTTQQWLTSYRSPGLAFNSVVLPATADTLDVSRIFDGRSTYAKGGLALHALRHVINNDSAFFAGLRAYQQQFAFGTATTADLQASLEAS